MRKFFKKWRHYLAYSFFFSFFINLLSLTFSYYMLTIYDQVLASYSLSTLKVITLAALFAHDDRQRFREVGWRLFAVNLLTLILFFFFYSELVKLQFLPGLLLLLRNGLVIWVVISLLRSDTPGADRRETADRQGTHARSPCAEPRAVSRPTACAVRPDAR